MPRRDRHMLLALATLSVAFGILQSATGISPDLLLAVPALLLVLPLLAGRYVGSEHLARLARRGAAPRHRGAEPRPAPSRPLRRAGARGGLLIAVALGRRGPPASALAR